MQAALVRCQERYTEALNWLSSEWGKLVQVVVSSTRSEGQRLDQNDIGELSEEEARKALRESLGDMVAAVKSCVAKRKQLVSICSSLLPTLSKNRNLCFAVVGVFFALYESRLDST